MTRIEPILVTHKRWGWGVAVAEDGPDVLVQFLRFNYTEKPPLLAVRLPRPKVFPAVQQSGSLPVTVAHDAMQELALHDAAAGGVPNKKRKKRKPKKDPAPAGPFANLKLEHLDLFARTWPKLFEYLLTARCHTTRARSKAERFMDTFTPWLKYNRLKGVEGKAEHSLVSPRLKKIFAPPVFKYARREAARLKTHTCPCGRTFVSKRRDAKYCGATCRKRASRE